MTKAKLDQINIVVRDMDAMAEFYQRLGVDLQDGQPEWSPHHRNNARGDGVDFDLDSQEFASVWNEGWPGGPGIVLGFRLPDRRAVDRVFAELTAAEWWDGAHFDGVVSSMALMDIDDLAGAVRTAAATLRTGGWFAWSINHPAFPGIEHVRSNWPTGGSYFDEGLWFTDGTGVRGTVGADHRTLSTYFRTLLDAGFALERIDEPPWQLSPEHPALPFFLITGWRRR
jgi:catechol 2,3-dioxygenase-like lactoylglutathione lyase family enzyme